MKLKLLALVLALQCAWLLATTFTQERALCVGQLIVLETRPVDPRDLLRGDYVTLGYTISDLPLKLLPDSVKMDRPYVGEIFVALAPAGTNQFWEITRAGTKRFKPEQGEVLLRGKTGNRWSNRPESVRVEYGLERYYVREGTGNPHGKLTVQAVVSASGRASIKEVFVDGKPYAEAMKESGK